MLSEKDYKYYSLSLKGINRSHNQDDVCVIHSMNYSLYVLFDGVSSYNDSIEVVKECKEYLNSYHTKYLNRENGLKDLICNMNLHAVKLAFKGKTTCSALLLDYKWDNAVVLNIGDSRAYTLSGSYIEAVTTDDNLFDNSNVLTKYIGMEELDSRDFVEQNFDLNQNFLLCSDGFYHMMHSNLKRYFKVFQFKRKTYLLNAILKLQSQHNKDDSTFILIKRNGI